MQRERALHLDFVMNFDEYVHALDDCLRFDFLHDRIVKRRDDDQDRIGPKGARFGHLPGVDHEILAQDRQFARPARGD